MNILTKFGGLVAVAALLMAAGSLLVSPTPAHAATDDACTAAGSAILSSGDGTAAGGAAITSVASGSTTTVYVLIDDPTATGQVIETSVSAGTLNGSSSSAVLGVTTGVAGTTGCTTNAGLATNDTVGTTNDDFAKYTFVAPTVASDTIVTITVKVQGVSQGFGAVTVSATVTPDSLVLGTPTNASIRATPIGGDAGDTSDITLTLKEGSTALQSQTVTVITTSGLLESDGAGACLTDADDNLDDGVQACTATTDVNGQEVVSLFGANSTGTATVTAVKGALSASKDVTLYGSAASASGSVSTTMQQVVGTTFLTMTVLDSSGNAVSGVVIGDPAVSGAATPVAVDNTVVPTLPAINCSAGTNGSGQCTIQVATTATSSLGDHTLTVTVPGVTAKPVIVIKVVGVTATITNDAPASVAGSSQTEIIATGVDANGDNIGTGVTTSAVIIEGNGGLLSVDGTTTNGEQKFTFVAPSSAGTTTILVTMGSASQLITISIGAAAPTPGEGFGGDLSSGVNLTTYGGGTVEQLGTDSATAGATSVAVTVDGAFLVYVVGAPAFVNQAFSDQYPDGVPAGTVVLVLVN